LPLQCRTVRLRRAATEVLYKEAGHASILNHNTKTTMQGSTVFGNPLTLLWPRRGTPEAHVKLLAGPMSHNLRRIIRRSRPVGLAGNIRGRAQVAPVSAGKALWFLSHNVSS
jgi:hypothetical protein